MSDETIHAQTCAPQTNQAPGLSIAPAAPESVPEPALGDGTDFAGKATAALQRALSVVREELAGLPAVSGEEKTGQARSVLQVCEHALARGIERL